MPHELIQIVNPNGRKGFVSASSAAAKTYKQPPSIRAAEPAKKTAAPRKRATKKTAAAKKTTDTSTPTTAHINESQED